MPPTACPTCIADASIEVAWSLFHPRQLDEWWDAKTRRVTPEGPLAVGQKVEAATGPLGIFAVTAVVLEVDAVGHRLRMVIRLPFGMINDETVTVVALGPDRCRISFG